MVPASRAFWLVSFYPRGRDPFHCLSGGGGGVQVHLTGFTLGQVQICRCQLRSWHMLDQDKGPIFSRLSYRRVYTPFSICLNLSTARLLHSYVCPSLVKDYRVVEMLAVWYCHNWSSLTILLTALHMTWLCILVFNLHALLLYMVTINFENPNSLIWWLFDPLLFHVW